MNGLKSLKNAVMFARASFDLVGLLSGDVNRPYPCKTLRRSRTFNSLCVGYGYVSLSHVDRAHGCTMILVSLFP
jgi:hypothetical protein